MNVSNRRHERGLSIVRVLAVIAAVIVVTIAGTAWWVGRYVYAKPIEPTQLTVAERRTLDGKLARLGAEPTPYSENDADREIRLTERELNGLVARDDDTARRVAIDLADDLVSVTMLVPFDEDFPLLGGKTLRIATGLELGYAEGRPVVAIRGISLGGVPLPKAWWGDIKGKNLVEEFGSSGGFWGQFSKGVDGIRIRDGELWVKLRE